MSESQPPDADNDPFRPPKQPTLVGCLHCGEEYESYLIEWRESVAADGKREGFWCCPIPGCSGAGFGFDILPVDPNYRDENGGWTSGTEDDDDWDEADGIDVRDETPDGESANGKLPDHGDPPW